VVFNDVQPDARTIKAKIREEYIRWRLARLYRSGSFRFPEPAGAIVVAGQRVKLGPEG
jgi:hypothetical protein